MNDGDITTNCGCTGVVPNARRIPPGGSVAVQAAVRTAGKSGPFSVGGSIRWTGPSGAVRTTRLLVRGKATPPLQTEPDVLDLSAADMTAVRFHDLIVTSVVPLDWGQLQIVCNSPSVRFGPRRRDGDRLIIPVTCNLPNSLEVLDETICLACPVTDPKSPLHGKNAAVSVPIRASRKTDFAVSPSTVVVTQVREQATAKLLIHGRRVRTGAPVIRAVRCDCRRVSWTVSEPTAGGVAILEITFVKGRETPAWLEIELEGAEPVRMPISWLEESPPAKGG